MILTFFVNNKLVPSKGVISNAPHIDDAMFFKGLDQKVLEHLSTKAMITYLKALELVT